MVTHLLNVGDTTEAPHSHHSLCWAAAREKKILGFSSTRMPVILCPGSGDHDLLLQTQWGEISQKEVDLARNIVEWGEPPLYVCSTCFHRRGSKTFISSWGNLMSTPFSRSSVRHSLSQTWTLKPPHARVFSASCVPATENAHIRDDTSAPLLSTEPRVHHSAQLLVSPPQSTSQGDPWVLYLWARWLP